MKEKKRRERVESDRVVAENLTRQEEDKQRVVAEKEMILIVAKTIEEREKIEGERWAKERSEKDAARESEVRDLAVVAAASQEERDNMMCSCTLSKFAPHRYLTAKQYLLMDFLRLLLFFVFED